MKLTPPAHHTHAPSKPDREHILDAIERSEIGSKIRAELAASRLRERTALRRALEKADAALSAEIPELELAIERAVQAVREAELAWADAISSARIARSAKASAIFEHDRLVQLYAGELRENCSPEVAEFARWLLDETYGLRKHLVIDRNIEMTLVGKRETVTSNSSALAARQKAIIRILQEEVPLLQIEPDDAAATAKIAALKEALPKIENTVTTDDEAR
ncbi:hypothetical protein WOC76_04405 [Methylocystis sp. IM3]|uniref:hypothetical protein n=1 Tax=unclassified Methylocystis TaxID=2625913 RepID=UPI0030F55A40